MLIRWALVRTEVWKESNNSIIRVTRIGKLETTLAVRNNRSTLLVSVASYGYVPGSPILVTLMMETLSSSEKAVLAISTPHNIPEDAFLHSHRRENLNFYRTLFVFNRF
jgi:hypothetical protein